MFMKLSHEQLESIVFGAVEILSAEDGLHFYKCSERQRNAWDKADSELGLRARATTGIRLDFHTDSAHLGFKLKGDKFELYTDGVLTRRIVGSSENELELTEELDGLGHRITLIFPSHGVGVLRSVTIDDSAYVEPHRFDGKMLFLGDSITQGWNSEFDSLSYAIRTADFFNAECVINGIGGAVFAPSSFDKISFDPDSVFVAYGTNDYWYYKDIEAFSENMTEYLRLVKQSYSDKRVFVILPIWRFDLKEAADYEKFGAYRAKIELAAQGFGFNIVDGYTLVPHITEFYSDAVHPNALGFGIYAQNLAKAVNASL